jgi:hypothetical protein
LTHTTRSAQSFSFSGSKYQKMRLFIGSGVLKGAFSHYYFFNMKNVIKGLALGLWSCLFFCGTSKGQETDSVTIKGGHIHTEFLSPEWGWNRLVPNSGGEWPESYAPLEQLGGKSLHFGLGIFRQRVNLFKHRLELEYGLGLGFDRYEWASDYIMAPYAPFVTPALDTATYQRNSLHITSLGIPLLLGFGRESGRYWADYRIAVGGYADVVMGAKSKRRADSGDRAKERGDFNLLPLRYGLRADAEYGPFGFFFQYALSPFFSPAEDGGYELRNITLGMRLSLFRF